MAAVSGPPAWGIEQSAARFPLLWQRETARRWRDLARRRRLAILVCGALPLLLRALLLPVMPIPNPGVHDEFSYLLAADTFAQGHLTNPTPPLWVHFETFHELMHPTYMSIYPPGQGAMLALGKVVFGNPWWAVWLSVGLMCAAAVWMLYEWLPPSWALFGGVLIALQFGIAHYWMNSYWGGSLAGLGGCLLLGATPRLRKRIRVRDALWFSCGLIALASSRPYEGAAVGAVAGAALLVGFWRRRVFTTARFYAAFGLPVLALVLPAAGLMLAENHAVTGSYGKLPHEVYRREVAIWPSFVFQKPRSAQTYHHAVMREFFTKWEPMLEEARQWGTLRGLIPGLKGRVLVVGSCYFPGSPYAPIAYLSLLAVFIRRTRLLGAAILAVLAADGFVNWLFPHYLAPVLGAFMAIHLQFLRYIRTRRWHWHGWPRAAMPGWRVVRTGQIIFAAILVFMGALFVARYIRRIPGPGDDLAGQRARILRTLEALPGQQLVLVRYRPGHDPGNEWVFNGPEIPREKVIWARAMTPAEDLELRRYFAQATAWDLEPDAHPLILKKLE